MTDANVTTMECLSRNRILSKQMLYKTRWSLFQVLHTKLHGVKTVQKVCRPVSDFLQVGLPRDVVIKLLHRQKTIG